MMTDEFRFSSLGSAQINFVALRQSAERNPVGMLNLCIEQSSLVDVGVRRSRWLVDVALFETAYAFDKPAHFDSLLQHPYFEKRKYKADRKNVLRLTLLAGLNAGVEGRTYQRACRVARALQPHFNDRIDTSAVLEIIEKAGGYSRMLSNDDCAEADDDFYFAEGATDHHDDDLTDDDQSADGTWTDSDESKSDHILPGTRKKSGTNSSRPRFDMAKHLLLEADMQQLSDVLSTPRRGLVQLAVRREDVAGDFCRFKVISVDF